MKLLFLVIVLFLGLFGCEDKCCKIKSEMVFKYDNMKLKIGKLDIKFLRYYHTLKMHCNGGFHRCEDVCGEDYLTYVEQQVQNDLLFLNSSNK
jgi:hypothetical protein